MAHAIWPHKLVAPTQAAAPSLLLAAFAALFPVGLYAQSALFAHSPAARKHGAHFAYRAAWLGTCAV